MRQADLASARKTLRRFGLTRTFLPAVVIDRLETALSVAAGEEVRHMRSYLVRIFLPQIIEIQAVDEAQALEQVGALYQEHYAKDFRDWIEPLEEPQERE